MEEGKVICKKCKGDCQILMCSCANWFGLNICVSTNPCLDIEMKIHRKIFRRKCPLCNGTGLMDWIDEYFQ
jgi:hypothetical protein